MCARILARFVFEIESSQKQSHPHPQLFLQAVGSPVTAPGFAVHLNKYVRSLPFFNTPPAAS